MFSTAALLFFIIDPFGLIPLSLSEWNKLPEERRTGVVIRGLLFALVALALVMLICSGQQPGGWPTWIAAVVLAWLGASIVLLMGARLARLVAARGLVALERLMGMLLVAISVEMMLSGIRAAQAVSEVR